MLCQRCKSKRLYTISAKCSNQFSGNIQNRDHEGYVPGDVGIGCGEFISFCYCLDCGQIQGNFPLPISTIEKDLTEAVVMDFYINNGLTPGGKKPSLEFWSMVDAAEKMNSYFSSFLRVAFKPNLINFNYSVESYISRYEIWEELFKAYNKHIQFLKARL